MQDLDREWSQEELRNHVRAVASIDVPEGESIPQSVKYLKAKEPPTKEELAWGRATIKQFMENAKED